MSLAELREQQARREHLLHLVIACAVALAIVGLGRSAVDDVTAAGASSDGCMGYRHLVAEVFPGEVERTCEIAWCESRGDAGAVSPTGDHGLLQINARTWNRPGHPDPVAHFIGTHWDVVYDPWSNLVMAQKIRHHYGWGMWSCA